MNQRRGVDLKEKNYLEKLKEIEKMRYYIDLFSPETARAFEHSKRDVSGYRISRNAYVQNQKIGPGDRFICYVTRIQRFIGVLEVVSEPYVGNTPIFNSENDPFILRFKVKPIVWLALEKAIPIREDKIWNHLSFTRGLPKGSTKWNYMVFSSPRSWPKEDCIFIENMLLEQTEEMRDYPFSEEDQNKLKIQKIRISGTKEVAVSVPEDDNTELKEGSKEERESISVQAKLAEIGDKLGLKIWIPMGDRKKVLTMWKPKDGVLLDHLPFAFEDVSLRTIKNIDVLWIKGRSIARAFEVEHTTAINSGILRMADLLAIQPMINIKAYIVAPDERHDKVFKEITRPVFAVIGGERSLSEVCSYIPYSAVYDLAKEKKLEHMNDSVVDSYALHPED